MDSTAPTTKTSLAELVDLHGRTAIVTGGAMGIGRGIVARLHEAGANVVVADLDRETAEEVVSDLDDRRVEGAVAVLADVSDPADVERMVKAAVDAFGALDILVNNAGIYPARSLAGLDLETFRRVLDVNLTG
ncbi:MAG: SDR family NAD(P)-dependent oxidoreductase, partial [Actinobacteria bacterium]|nr:SDR family NAD(P)-dependent oxidoreductase [Actinomycetota bacterium]